MSEEQLFEWDTPKKQRQEKPKQELVRRPPGYHLISTRQGPVGYHRDRISADMSVYRSCITLCGIAGRRVGEANWAREIPLCEECELKHANP